MLYRYVTNQAAAEELEVGRGLGCSYATGQCEKFLKEDPKNNNFCPSSWNDGKPLAPVVPLPHLLALTVKQGAAGSTVTAVTAVARYRESGAEAFRPRLLLVPHRLV